MQAEKLASIGARFRLAGSFLGYEPIKTGNINATYKVLYQRPDGQEHSYIFQNINTYVFREPEKIMENIDLVTEHIRSRYPNEITLHFHHTAEGKNYLYDADGGFWRVMNYVDSISYDTCEDPDVVRATGEAFGQFQHQLADLDGSLLHETIPDFHNTRKRLDTFFQDVEKDLFRRCREAEEEIAWLSSVREEVCRLSDLYNQGKFPVRVTHNDTKCNNVLFDRITNRPILVVDLDTVMPGLSVYDFGDAVRCSCSTAPEDEADLSRVSFDTGKFQLFCQGYLSTMKDELLPVERVNLVNGAFSITVELGSRFLDDYLTGDTYFKVDYPGHNLVRAKCQLTLARDILRKQKQLEAILEEILAE